MIFVIATAAVFESVFYLWMNFRTLYARQKTVEDFEYVIFYLSSQFENVKRFKIRRGENWSVLLVDTSPVLAFEIFGSEKVLMRRLVEKRGLSFEKLEKMCLGLSFFNGRNFSGFNVVCKGKGRMYFQRIGKHLIFVWEDRWVYLM